MMIFCSLPVMLTLPVTSKSWFPYIFLMIIVNQNYELVTLSSSSTPIKTHSSSLYSWICSVIASRSCEAITPQIDGQPAQHHHSNPHYHLTQFQRKNVLTILLIVLFCTCDIFVTQPRAKKNYFSAINTNFTVLI